ncbi:adenylate kinase [Tieghemostelium lacteum]|uniref:Adenylate kinase n=1 Tax=Tieghemostelium lacteum TaxID=361077 RepID=A0A151Z5W7_TIELA|nr:adenylate kinase [Tieghemostelium lacteum]|eukprot:KYQ89351.1 adenylate kinase [Tieghemostelium lacteum]
MPVTRSRKPKQSLDMDHTITNIIVNNQNNNNLNNGNGVLPFLLTEIQSMASLQSTKPLQITQQQQQQPPLSLPLPQPQQQQQPQPQQQQIRQPTTTATTTITAPSTPPPSSPLMNSQNNNNTIAGNSSIDQKVQSSLQLLRSINSSGGNVSETPGAGSSQEILSPPPPTNGKSKKPGRPAKKPAQSKVTGKRPQRSNSMSDIQQQQQQSADDGENDTEEEDENMDDIVSSQSKKKPAARATKRSKSASFAESKTGSASGDDLMGSQSGNRFDNSLVQLTKKFLEIMGKSSEGIVDLKVAADQLEISKRRIYDVTCVLEGVGLIEKCSKNRVQWKAYGVKTMPVDPKYVDVYKRDIKKLKEKEAALDSNIKKAQKNLSVMLTDSKSSRYIYVTHDDLRDIERMKNDTVIAIKAPAGTKLEVPDPDEGMEPPNRRYQVFLHNEGGQTIDVFLLNQPNSNTSNSSDDMDTSYNAQPPQPPMTNAPNNHNQFIYPTGHIGNDQIFSPSKQHLNNNIYSGLGNPNVSYWEPNSMISSYSPYDQNANNNNNNNNNNHHLPTNIPNSPSISNMQPPQSPLHPNRQITFQVPTDNYDQQSFYFDTVIANEGISELYTDDSFLTQSFDDFGNQSIDAQL